MLVQAGARCSLVVPPPSPTLPPSFPYSLPSFLGFHSFQSAVRHFCLAYQDRFAASAQLGVCHSVLFTLIPLIFNLLADETFFFFFFFLVVVVTSRFKEGKANQSKDGSEVSLHRRSGASRLQLPSLYCPLRPPSVSAHSERQGPCLICGCNRLDGEKKKKKRSKITCVAEVRE